jgi:hypothetical protein
MTHPVYGEMKASREAKLNSMVGKRAAHHELPSEKADRLAYDSGGVVQLPSPDPSRAIEAQAANAEAAKRGGYGYSPKNVDFGLLNKLGK